MKEFEIVFERYDFVFSKSVEVKTDYFFAESESEAKSKATWVYGNLVYFLSVKEYKSDNDSYWCNKEQAA